ncbi:hypothetical protein ACN6MY_18705 [Peribacillus sp. B-H-3]|jgi:transposase|uniref:hypothetical protein n=1 Tax=Peribacillus sp. B-H-3 TaxID=3400420 RepID=UPI003B01C486
MIKKNVDQNLSIVANLSIYWTLKEKAGKAKILEHIEEMRIKRSTSWMMEKADKLMVSAKRNPFQQGVYESHLFSLDMYINMLLQYQEHLSSLERQIDVLAAYLE